MEVIRVDFEQNSTSESIDIQLFDNIALDTVNNFLSYVDDGSYDKLFINRSVQDFVVQTGGYTFDSALGGFSITETDLYDGGLQPVTAKPTVDNQFQLSNLRGTLAMAKKQNLPDSATKEWFINLVDNTFLDDNNGGFTVFGKVLGSGMTTVDSLATIPVYNLSTDLNNNGNFVQTPLTNFNSSLTAADITDNNLIFLQNFEHLFKIVDTLDFGDAVAGTSVQQDVVITNTGGASFTIGSIDTSAVSSPFSIMLNTCDNSTLSAGATCNITVDFSPITNDYFLNTIDIPIQTYGYTFPVTLKTPLPKLVIDKDAINFGAQPVFDSNSTEAPKQNIIYLNNEGDRDLNVSSVTFSGSDAAEFEFVDNCKTDGNAHSPGIIPPDGFCILAVKFKPLDLNKKFALIEITTNDPNNSQISITVEGGATDDNDDIAKSIEDAAPNDGDGNNDGLPDGLQDNVVSFSATNNVYTTVVADSSLKFTKFNPVELSTIVALPVDVILDNEAFSFELTGIIAGDIAQFGIILPNGNSPTNIYSFGVTLNNDEPHWYTLEKDATPGVFIIGNATLSGPTETSIKRNITQVTIVDGGLGDSDLLANGKITFFGGPEVIIKESSSSGTLLWLLILIPFSIVTYRK